MSRLSLRAIQGKEEQAIDSLIDSCVGRGLNERIKNLSDEEITRVFAQCVGGHRIVPLIKSMRDTGMSFNKFKKMKLGNCELNKYHPMSIHFLGKSQLKLF